MAQTTLDQRMLGVGTALTDHTITASDVITFADVGDSNLTKKDTVQGVLDLAGGTLEFIGKVTASSGDASVAVESGSMTSSTYEGYKCYYTAQHGTTATSANVTLRNNGSYVTSYWGHGIRMTQSGQGYANYSGNAAHPLDGGTGLVGNVANQHSWTIDIVLHPTKYITIISHGTHIQDGGTEQTTFLATWADATFAEMDGIKITPSSGTLMGGKLVVYGLKGS